MKIAVLIDTWFPFIGGGQINAWEVSNQLSKSGENIEIITRNCGKDYHKNTKNLKIVKLGKASKIEDELTRLMFLIKSFLYLSKSNFDLVIAHAFLPGIIAKLFMIIKKKPAILIVHGTSINTNLNHGYKLWLEKFILTKIKYSAQITVSRDFLKIKNVNKKIIYVTNGINPIFLKPRKDIQRLKNTLLFVGRLHPQKNLINLIKAIKLLKNEDFPVKLIIIGDGPQKKELRNLIKDENLTNRISLLDPKAPKELVHYYQISSAFILPSIYEGQALTLLEAIASNLPVIASKTGDNLYIVKEGINGHFINNVLKAENIAQTIKNVLGKKGIRNTKNHLNFIQNYSWENSASLTKKVYEKIN